MLFFTRTLEVEAELFNGYWSVKFPDGHTETFSLDDFEARFVGHDEITTLKESLDRLAVTLGGISKAAIGEFPKDIKPNYAIQEVLRLREFVENVIWIEAKILRPSDQLEAIEKLIREFNNAS